MKLAINGLGRVGRLVLRQLVTEGRVEVVAVNDPAEARTLAHLVKYDSVHGRADFSVSSEDGTLFLDGRRIPAFREREPGAAPFADFGAELVLECSGQAPDRSRAAAFLRGPVEHVLVSEPMADADLTVVMGVNHARLRAGTHRVISAASCTANCLGI
ncbi:MAG TPA: glyceraldehyde 3-phosphate dehydrogenase NAD-binding domain-containing protein, partial [Geobacteraceae bacterium]